MSFSVIFKVLYGLLLTPDTDNPVCLSYSPIWCDSDEVPEA